MHFDISGGGSGFTYETRNQVPIAKKLQKMAIGQITWGNIGDSVQKGERIPRWMKEVLFDIIKDNASHVYLPTKRIDVARTFLAGRAMRLDGSL